MKDILNTAVAVNNDIQYVDAASRFFHPALSYQGLHHHISPYGIYTSCLSPECFLPICSSCLDTQHPEINYYCILCSMCLLVKVFWVGIFMNTILSTWSHMVLGSHPSVFFNQRLCIDNHNILTVNTIVSNSVSMISIWKCIQNNCFYNKIHQTKK